MGHLMPGFNTFAWIEVEERSQEEIKVNTSSNTDLTLYNISYSYL